MKINRFITVSYLAKITGVEEETIWRNVKELLTIIEEEPFRGKLVVNEEGEDGFHDYLVHDTSC